MKKYGKLTNFSRTIAGKTIAFILCTLSVFLCGASSFAVVMLSIYNANNMYSLQSEKEIFIELVDDELVSTGYNIVHETVNGSKYISGYQNESGISYRMFDSSGKLLFSSSNYSDKDKELSEHGYTVLSKNSKLELIIINEDQYYIQDAYDPENCDTYENFTVKAYRCSDLPLNDYYAQYETLAHLIFTYKYTLIAVIPLSLLAALIFFIVLMCASARVPDSDELCSGPLNRVPFDLLTAAVAIVSLIIIDIGVTVIREVIHNELIGIAIIAYVILNICLGWCMSFSARIKQKNLLTNTVIYFLLKILWRVLKAIWNALKSLYRFNVKILTSLPLIWQTALIILAVTIIEFAAVMLSWYETDNYLVFWVIKTLIIIPLLLWFALLLRNIEKGGKMLASGNLNHRVDTKGMFGAVKTHGENLNKISEGMSRAVEQKMKSERIKTELITNVSHDIKTPLTSIINYADLISHEQTENEKIKEYSDVLLRQSQRLKRLTEDLIEASKASSGNLDVQLTECDAGVFVTQLAGEYEEILNNANITLIAKHPEMPMTIMADSRRMQRIFDNLFTNIRKYSLPGTRAYLSLDEVSGNAIFMLKNTSRNELDMTEDELFERFKRGDSSRHTEGNGLGLSIARSLTELQNGTMHIYTDGDLFKVVLTFPIIR